MESIISILAAILAVGFVALGLVAFVAWRARMREHVVNADLPAVQTARAALAAPRTLSATDHQRAA